MTSVEELVTQAQDAMRLSSGAYRKQLLGEVFQLKHEPGVQKVLALAKEMRAKSLFDLTSGKKESFDANQATWRAWDYLVSVIEVGPRKIDIPEEQEK